MKLEICDYLNGMKTHMHANPYGAATTSVVWANSQFVTVGFVPCLLCFYTSPTGRTVGPILTFCTSYDVFSVFGQGGRRHFENVEVDVCSQLFTLSR